MAKMNDDMNETSFVHSITKRQLQIKAQAQAADFYMPNQFSDTIVLKNGCPWMRDWPNQCPWMRDWPNWPNHDLVNTKKGWESLGVINGNLISGELQDYAGNYYPIPQTMAGIEIEVDSDEFQAWYKLFTTFPLQAISEAQYQINTVINKYIEGGNRTNRQKQGYFYATKRHRDLKIILYIISRLCDADGPGTTGREVHWASAPVQCSSRPRQQASCAPPPSSRLEPAAGWRPMQCSRSLRRPRQQASCAPPPSSRPGSRPEPAA
jgi:hypothetical protein